MTDLSVFDPTKVRAIIEAKDTLIAELWKKVECYGPGFSDATYRAEKAEAALAAMKNERDEAMNAGYTQGVENAEARASKRIHQLEALDPIRALLDQGKDALIESLKARLVPVSDEEEREALAWADTFGKWEGVEGIPDRHCAILARLLRQRTAKLREAEAKITALQDLVSRGKI